jgi:multiple sugar transport system permease protein
VRTAGIELAEERRKGVKEVRARRDRHIAWKDILSGYIMIAPLMIGLFIFYLWPVFQTFYFSFTKWGAFGKYKWTGLANYEHLLHDPDLGRALLNTVVYILLSVPGSLILAILVAVLLNQKIRGVGIYRTLYYLPAVTMPAAIAMVWRWLYNGDYGLINYLLSLFGLHGPRWLSDPAIALYSIILVAIWGAIGTNMILFLAGLQGIPGVYYEAAAIDGAGPLPRFFRITLPLLSPTIFFALVTSLIGAFQVFDLIFLMTGPNSPALDATKTIVYLFYQYAFITNDKGYAATIAVLLFVIILLITLVQFRLQRRWVHYS